MKIVVIDGQGGGLGKVIIEQIRKEFETVEIMAVGANALATAAMLKAGAQAGATGDNAIAYNCSDADIIIGALGIGFANSMHGEISPRAAHAVSTSGAHKILIPVSRCNVSVAGVPDRPMSFYMEEMITILRKHLS